jgi:sec-independent protein translocase protein TatB
MFDIGGYELILIAAVAILVVGPRELPGMLRSVGRFVTQARQMMTGVQRQFNDALKEAELDDVKKTIDDVRSLNPTNKLRKTIAKELQPFTDAGDSVKKSVGQVSAKGPAPAAAAAAVTPAAAETTSTPVTEDLPAGSPAPKAKTSAAKTSTVKTANANPTTAKKPAAKKPAAKKVAGQPKAARSTPASKPSTSKAAASRGTKPKVSASDGG